MPDLKRELKELLIATLSLEDVTPATIDDAAPLFGAGLGLDSIDALELAVALERRFHISIPDEDVAKQAFASIDALAAFVEAARGQ
ncbi:MAG: acyl carrier protein [Deltaproteobacteria bacterium]|nr:acyl carrier protein [Deltaproteobacteria bacterium]